MDKLFTLLVTYQGTWDEVVVMRAATKEEAMQKLANGEDVEDVLDTRDYMVKGIMNIR